MNGFKISIEKATQENSNFRKVLYTSKHSQLVLMSLLPHEDIGEEIHTDNDQFFRFESGKGNPTLLTLQKIADVLGMELSLSLKNLQKIK